MAGGALGGEVSRSGYASPSVGGALTAGGEYQMDLKRAEKLIFLARGGSTNLSRAAIRFVLGESKVSIAMVGFSDLKQIEEAAASSDSGNLGPSELDRVKKIWATNFTG
jgi:aryl-alcohol dehydrogenase-like predicted oxidoreductase